METMFVMPPTVQYPYIGKGQQMTYDETQGVFVAYDLKYPKSIQCLLAVTGTKFGRVDWNTPVFGMYKDKLTLITREQFDAGEATAIILEDDRYETIDTIIFNPITFEVTIGGTIAMPVTALDVLTDLAEEPAYIASSSARKEYRGAKIFFDKDSEVEITGVTDLSKAYNLDWMEYLGGNKIKFLGDKGMYYLSYKVAEDYLVVEPLYELTEPDVDAIQSMALTTGQTIQLFTLHLKLNEQDREWYTNETNRLSQETGYRFNARASGDDALRVEQFDQDVLARIIGGGADGGISIRVQIFQSASISTRKRSAR